MNIEEFKYFLLQYCNDKVVEFSRFNESYYKGRCKSYEDLKRFIVALFEFEEERKNKNDNTNECI